MPCGPVIVLKSRKSPVIIWETSQQIEGGGISACEDIPSSILLHVAPEASAKVSHFHQQIGHIPVLLLEAFLVSQVSRD